MMSQTEDITNRLRDELRKLGLEVPDDELDAAVDELIEGKADAD